MKKIALVLSLLNLFFVVSAQTLSIDWQKTFGGSEYDGIKQIHQTTDGGYILGGISFSSDGESSGQLGVCDAWVIKLKADKSIDWRKNYGGSNDDGIYSIQQTSDGGYIMAGYTKSNDGNVTGFKGNIDIWVVKINAQGIIQWQKTFGGTASEVASAIKQTTDGSYIVTGYTTSANGDITQRYGNANQDIWVLKLSAQGNIQWQKCYGGSDNDFAYDIEPTNNNEYIVTGYSKSNDGDIASNKGGQDTWTFKLDNSGNIKWQKSIGGSNHEQGQDIITTSDGGFLLAGTTSSTNQDINGNHGLADALIIKFSSNGNVEWQKCFGGTDLDAIRQIVQTTDGGFIGIGSAESNNGDITNNKGKSDLWVIKLNSTGNIEWQKTFGGSDIDDGFAICLSNTGNIILVGTTFSNDHDVNNTSLGAGDSWIVQLKLVPPLPIIAIQPQDQTACAGQKASFTITANNATSFQWQVLENNTWINLADDATYNGTSLQTMQIQNTTGLNGKQYRCICSNTHGQTISNAALLNINQLPIIAAHPKNVNSCSNKDIIIALSANSAINYQWQVNKNGVVWDDIPSSNNDSLVIHTTLANNGFAYRCKVSNNCGSTISNAALVNIYDCTIPNAFSPNGDGVNDVWTIDFLKNFPSSSIEVFNRNGANIFTSKQGNSKQWNGMLNGKPLPIGTYYYVINLYNGNNLLSGHISIVR